MSEAIRAARLRKPLVRKAITLSCLTRGRIPLSEWLLAALTVELRHRVNPDRLVEIEVDAIVGDGSR